MDWFVLALLSAFFAALVSILAKIGLNTVDATVATVVRSTIMMMFIVTFVIATGRCSSLTQLNSRHMGFIVCQESAEPYYGFFYFTALR